MVLEYLDFSLFIVGPVITWGDELVIDIHGIHGHFYSFQYIFVYDMGPCVDSAAF